MEGVAAFDRLVGARFAFGHLQTQVASCQHPDRNNDENTHFEFGRPAGFQHAKREKAHPRPGARSVTRMFCRESMTNEKVRTGDVFTPGYIAITSSKDVQGIQAASASQAAVDLGTSIHVQRLMQHGTTAETCAGPQWPAEEQEQCPRARRSPDVRGRP